MTYKITYEGKVPSKKNTFTINFNQAFFKLINPIVRNFRYRGINSLYWIAPSKEVKTFEKKLSTMILAAFGAAKKHEFKDKDIAVNVKIKQKRSRDADNALGAIGDAIQKGIPGFNDKQIKQWNIKIEKDVKDLLDIQLTILE